MDASLDPHSPFSGPKIFSNICRKGAFGEITREKWPDQDCVPIDDTPAKKRLTKDYIIAVRGKLRDGLVGLLFGARSGQYRTTQRPKMTHLM
ncbi:MAG: hypothetical protein CM15mP46_4170 [Alphaproteobacteria bacterium]|nr:MAG: hypothetical protein CM15mP46_4170 [Alphaproteobacteria bacterium]